jgi:hypothetical protein
LGSDDWRAGSLEPDLVDIHVVVHIAPTGAVIPWSRLRWPVVFVYRC